MNRIIRLGVIAALAIGVLTSAAAGASTKTLHGTTYLQHAGTNSYVPGQVQLVFTSATKTYKVKSSNAGAFNVAMADGTYAVTVDKPNFATLAPVSSAPVVVASGGARDFYVK